jgi:hypothetical protein
METGSVIRRRLRGVVREPRRGTACQCPAIRGRRRCRLHGGLSTGPRTAEGLARIRQANTRHGRYSREQVELARRMREFQMNGIKSARAMRSPLMRAYFLQVASEAIPPRILEEMRERVRVEVARQDHQRLRDNTRSAE